MTEVYDISLPLTSMLPVWPGSQRFEMARILRMSDGDYCNESSISLSIHTGTHIDAPWHFRDDGHRMESVDLAKMIGPVHVADLRGVSEISSRTLKSLDCPDGMNRLLLKTDNSELWHRGVETFETNFTALTVDAAEWLAEKEIDLVGIDYLSIQLYGDDNRTHEALLEAGIVILEGLNLHGIAPGEYELICLPLAIHGAEGAPARAVLRQLSDQTAT